MKRDYRLSLDDIMDSIKKVEKVLTKKYFRGKNAYQ